ncbi:hypothetical protein P8848_13280 [Bacillus spizizenii]|nr:hypothetical protein [Bacillus spizizenii]
MAILIDDKLRFFEKYNIKEEEFNRSGLQWDSLKEIYSHYLKQKTLLENTGKTIADILRTEPAAHTVRMRIKDPEHLIEKLIRKKIKDNNFSFSIEDYMEKVTDLIGLRVLHLYKSEALKIDEMIRDQWELAETVTIYFREGDMDDKAQEKLRRKGKFKPEKHKYGYRSWHYLIKCRLTKVQLIAEIQVRTIFEEGWSEIDHKLRYPYNLNNENLKNQLLVLNRLAGSADEMVNSIVETKQQIDKLDNENTESKKEIAQLREKIEQMKVDQQEKESLIASLNKIEDKQNMRNKLSSPDYFISFDDHRNFTLDTSTSIMERASTVPGILKSSVFYETSSEIPSTDDIINKALNNAKISTNYKSIKSDIE